MSQEHTTMSARRQRRVSRGQRNRPTLVSSSEQGVDDLPALPETDASAQEAPAQVAEPVSVATETPVKEVTPKRRLPGFFSTVGKSETESKETAEEARLARAMRSKSSATATQSKKSADEEKKATPSTTSSAKTSTTSKTTATTGRPAQRSTFKPKHMLGIAIYLLCANFIGFGEAALLSSLHLESTLTQFNLLGAPVIIRSSTLMFLATLVILLIVLAKLDLIPTTLGATPPPKRGTTQSRSSSEPGVRAPQPTMRQGVKGADDHLYEEYRLSQRREKKR